MPTRMLATTWREHGAGGCARKLSAATRMALPIVLLGRRTGIGVGAYFDLITDDGRLFYGDSFHFGYFATGTETLAQALDAPFTRRTGMVSSVVHPARAELRVLANPLKIDGVRLEQRVCSPLGADTALVPPPECATT